MRRKERKVDVSIRTGKSARGLERVRVRARTCVALSDGR